MPKKTKEPTANEIEQWPIKRLTYIGRRYSGGKLAHYYIIGDDDGDHAIFPKKLSQEHVVGGIYDARTKDGRYVVWRKAGAVGHYGVRAKVVEWNSLDKAAAAAQEMAGADGRHMRAVIDAHLGPVRVAYHKLDRTGRAAMIGVLIEYLNEGDGSEDALRKALEQITGLSENLKSSTERVKKLTKDIE